MGIKIGNCLSETSKFNWKMDSGRSNSNEIKLVLNNFVIKHAIEISQSLVQFFLTLFVLFMFQNNYNKDI